MVEMGWKLLPRQQFWNDGWLRTTNIWMYTAQMVKVTAAFNKEFEAVFLWGKFTTPGALLLECLRSVPYVQPAPFQTHGRPRHSQYHVT